MKPAKSPDGEQIKPYDHVLVSVGNVFVRANFEEALVPRKPGFSTDYGKWISRYRLEKPGQDFLDAEQGTAIQVEKDSVSQVYRWDDGMRRISYEGSSKLYVPQIFADEYFVALNGFARTFSGGCSIREQEKNRVITTVHMANDYVAAGVIGLLTLGRRMGAPPIL